MPESVLPHTDFDPHGGPDGGTSARIDFSVNSNPLGPALGLLQHLVHTPIHTYPDPTYITEKRLAAAHHRVDENRICFGNGTAELIHRLSRCYLDSSRRALIAAPTFGEYARAAKLCGAAVHHHAPYQEDVPDVATLLEPIRRLAPTLVWLCHPNNPTGHAWREEDLTSIAEACRKQDALLVLDLAYVDFLEYSIPTLLTNTVQLYSLTKSFRMPGVRLGYALTPPDVAKVLERAAPPWSVSAHAQAAARWAFSEKGQDFLRQTLPQLQDIRRDFQTKLRALGFNVQNTDTNYFLLEVGDAPMFKRAALEAGFRVRDCSSFGLPRMVRLAAQRPEENAAFVRWLEQWSRSG